MPSICFLYTVYILIAKSGDQKKILNFLNIAHFASPEGGPSVLATNILETYKTIRGE